MLHGDEGDRTLNLRLAKPSLSQLSYVPGWTGGAGRDTILAAAGLRRQAGRGEVGRAASRAGELVMIHVGFAEADITPKPGSREPGGDGEAGSSTRSTTRSRRSRWSIRSGEPDRRPGRDRRPRSSPAEVDGRGPGDRSSGEAKIPGDHVLIGASHTHSGGPIADVLRVGGRPGLSSTRRRPDRRGRGRGQRPAPRGRGRRRDAGTSRASASTDGS